jgi:hypothetical protein
VSSACARFRNAVESQLDEGRSGASGGHALDCAPCRAFLARAASLERVLALLPPPPAPFGLARRLLARLSSARGAESAMDVASAGDALDELLEHLPSPELPPDLAERALARLRAARTPLAVPAARRRWPWVAAAAALAGIALSTWTFRGERMEPELELEADEELLAYAVERWELLQDEDLDLWLASLDPLDEILIEYVDSESWGVASGLEGVRMDAREE